MTLSALGYWILIVSFAKGDTGGLYLAKLDAHTQTITLVQHITEGINRPIFARFNFDGSQLIVVDNDGDDPKTRHGALAVFAFDNKTGKLTLKGRTSTLGRGSCYVGITPPPGSYPVNLQGLALVANYGGANVAAIPFDATGPLDGSVSFDHTGSSAHPRRQKDPHPHSFAPSPDGRFALSADLGTDEVTIHPITAENKVLPVSSTIKLQPGAGPRHLAFSADSKLLFVINELDSTLNSYAWDRKHGKATLSDSVSVLPPDFKGNNSAADIYTHPDLPLVYTSNRGVDSIAISSFDDAGKLKLITNIPTGGGHPRGFALTPDARFLLAANRDANNVVLFTLDEKTGIPTNSGQQLSIEKPMCITTLPIR